MEFIIDVRVNVSAENAEEAQNIVFALLEGKNPSLMGIGENTHN